MLKLESIDISNFGSYKSSVKVGPFSEEWTVCIGSNGSGKSTILKAICWTLGCLEEKELKTFSSTNVSLNFENGLSINRCGSNKNKFVLSIPQKSSNQQQEQQDDDYSIRRRKLNKQQLFDYFKENFQWDLNLPQRFVIHQNRVTRSLDGLPLLQLLEGVVGTVHLVEQIEVQRSMVLKYRSETENFANDEENLQIKLNQLQPAVDSLENYKKLEEKYKKSQQQFFIQQKVLFSFRINSLSKESTTLEEKLLKLNESQKLEIENLEKLKKEKQTLKQQLEQSEKEMNEFNSFGNEANEKTIQLNVQLDEKRKQINRIEKRIEKLTDNVQNEEENELKWKQEMNSNENSIKMISNELESTKRMTVDSEMKFETLSDENAILKSQLNSFQAEKQEISQQLDQQKQLKFQEDQLKPIKSNLEKHLDAIMKSDPTLKCTLLRKIVKVTDAKYVLAVNSALRDKLNHVIVQTREDAKKIISYFKSNQIGLVTCEILNEIENVNNQQRSNSGYYLIAKPLENFLTLINPNQQHFKQLISKWCFYWLVCANREDASSVSQRFKMNCISIDAERFMSSGEIERSKKSSNSENWILSNSTSNQQQQQQPQQQKISQIDLNRIEIEIQQISTKLSILKRDLESTNERIESQRKSQLELNSQSFKLQSKRKQLENSKPKQIPISTTATTSKNIESLISNLTNQKDQFKNEMKSIQLELEKCHSENENHSTIKKSLKSKFNSISKQLTTVRTSIEQSNRKISELKHNISQTSLRIENVEQTKHSIQQKMKQANQFFQNQTEQAQENLQEEEEEECQKDINAFESKLEQTKARSKLLSIEIEKQRETIDLNALELYESTQTTLFELRKTNQELMQKIIDCEKQQEQISMKRQNLLSNAIKNLNVLISSFFRELSGGSASSDCFLTYSETKGSDGFEEFPVLMVRPERETWKSFSDCSGGQKSLASLSLSLACQELFPSPLCLFDEIDAALDSLAVERVAVLFDRLTKKQNATQFVLVSLRPQLYECAPHLLAAYQGIDQSSMEPISLVMN